MEIHIATAGLCFGIERAYKMIDKLAAGDRPLHAGHKCSGHHKNSEWDTFHRVERGDPQLLMRHPNLKKLTIVHDVNELKAGDALAIGYHGYVPELMSELKERGVELHDYMCPFIARMHNTAEKLANEGYDIIAFGKPQNHHTLYSKQAAERAGRVALIAETLQEIESALEETGRNWACIGQVTGNVEKWKAFSSALQARNIPIHTIDTVCTDSYDRQGEAMELAKRADTVVLVDDGGGSSISVLEACQSVNARVYPHGTDMPLRPEWFEDAASVAVVGGILVPRWTLDAVAKEIRRLLDAPAPQASPIVE